METVSINTTQNVEISYKVAGVGDRCIAFLIDIAFIFAYLFAVSFVFDLGQTLAGIRDLDANITIRVFIYLPVFFYHLLFEVFMNGQSLGKRIMRIKVVKLDNSRPGFLDYFLRWILRIIDITLTSGAAAILTIIFNGKGQRIGDLAAGTTVVKITGDVGLEETILTHVREDYTPSFSQVTQLTDEDMETVRKVLALETEDRKIGDQMAFRAKAALQKKMDVQSEMSPWTFLQTVLNDYNYYLQKKEFTLK
jgi:uncharacterized RDD family membrane protein YckC